MLTMKQHISMLAAYTGISLAELGKRIGLARQNFYKKLRLNTLTPEDMARIAEAVGAKYKGVFMLPDGKEISTDM